nr:phenylalanine ammonia-lyase [Panus rudis]
MPTQTNYQHDSEHTGFANLTAVRDVVKSATNGLASATNSVSESRSAPSDTLLSKFVQAQKELLQYRSGKVIKIDGHTLTVPAVAAAARFGAQASLDDSSELKEKVLKSRQVVVDKVNGNISIYGVSTGFGGSADTRTDDPIKLGHALLQHLQTGVLPSDPATAPKVLPLLDPLTSTSMPESWVRGAILIRMNSLIRGHSGVRWELIEKMGELLKEDITPLVPLRGSISASGDLTPLSYIAGTLIGNPNIKVYEGPRDGVRRIVSSDKALAAHGVAPLPLSSKEHLGILNGTAFSASVAALALNDAVHMALLASVCTAMGTEAMLGTVGSFHPFIHDKARPHPGQIEVAKTIRELLSGSKLAITAEEEKHISEDVGELRQDRYPLRTAAQFLGPQVEDILAALGTINLECNSTTDNPLMDGETGEVHHGGNFQAMAVTNAMEKTRLALHHIGKLLFAQCTELINPAMNRGLPPNLAATDPSLNYHAKGIDVHTAAYVGELGYLASPVSTHVQSAEMHNQSVNSLALISARATVNSLEVLSLLTSSYLYALCQAIVEVEISRLFGDSFTPEQARTLSSAVYKAVKRTFDTTSVLDAGLRTQKLAAAAVAPIVEFAATVPSLSNTFVGSIADLRSEIAAKSKALLESLRKDYLSGAKGPAPAAAYLGRTTVQDRQSRQICHPKRLPYLSTLPVLHCRPVYEYVRVTLGVKMHGATNLSEFETPDDSTVGQNIALIHEAIRDGNLQPVILSLFESSD